ncbi:MAG: CopD family protein, partial [Gemmatimonadetes bacterium]|nr:CopD family protein [Gemmatimonadota bacterium]
TETGWGKRWLQLALAGAMGAVGVLVPFPRWRSTGAPMTALAVAVAMSGLGHAGADEAWPRLARLVDTGHVLAAGGWLGGLALLCADVAKCSNSDIAMARWSWFSGAAMLMAPLTFVTGAGNTLLRLAGAPLAATVASDYGRLLALKGALALGVLALGWASHRRVRRGATPAARALRAELLLALAVFAATAVLTRSEPPVAP